MSIFVVETIMTYRMTYFVKAREATHAIDEVVCNENNYDFIEGAQHHLGEQISNCTEVSEEEFLRIFDKENDYHRNWTKEKKLKMINEIDYDR